MDFSKFHILFDIDNTLTRYNERFFEIQKMESGSPFLKEIQKMMLLRGWTPENAFQDVDRETNQVLRWDYSDLIRKFSLSWSESDQAMERLHDEILNPCEDAVDAMKTLYRGGAHLYIVSNNPYWGCRWKLRRAGLENIKFECIFSTDFMGGCKRVDGVWNFVLSRIGAEPECICTVGDDPLEDGILPQKAGALHSFLLWRGDPSAMPASTEHSHFMIDAREMFPFLLNQEF